MKEWCRLFGVRWKVSGGFVGAREVALGFGVGGVSETSGLEIIIGEIWGLMFLGEIIRLFYVGDIVLIKSRVPGPFVCAVQRRI